MVRSEGVSSKLYKDVGGKHTKQNKTDNMSWKEALQLYLKSTCFLSALLLEILVRISVQHCGENHSGQNCAVEQRSSANCVPQGICENCAAAAAKIVLYLSILFDPSGKP